MFWQKDSASATVVSYSFYLSLLQSAYNINCVVLISCMHNLIFIYFGIKIQSFSVSIASFNLHYTFMEMEGVFVSIKELLQLNMKIILMKL